MIEFDVLPLTTDFPDNDYNGLIFTGYILPHRGNAKGHGNGWMFFMKRLR